MATKVPDGYVDLTPDWILPKEEGSIWEGVYKGWETQTMEMDDGTTRRLLIHKLETETGDIISIMGGGHLDFLLAGKKRDSAIDDLEPNPAYFGKRVALLYCGDVKLSGGQSAHRWKILQRKESQNGGSGKAQPRRK